MSRNITKVPPLRRKKVGKRYVYAVVTLDGRERICGHHGTDEAEDEYRRLIRESLVRGGQAPRNGSSTSDLTINELMLSYWEFAKEYYQPAADAECSELENIRQALRPLKRLYGNTVVSEFGPLALEAVRQEMIEQGWARGWINRNVTRIKGFFKWGTARELVPPHVYEGLRCVAGLKKGRSKARDPEPVKPVPESHISPIQPYVTRQIWAMAQLQLRSGMRPGETVKMRGCDLDCSVSPWRYTPASHKTAYRGHGRVIFLGPQAQEILKPFLKHDLEAYLFSALEAVEAARATRRQARRTPMTASQAKRRRKTNPKRRPGERYTIDSYRYAITKACKRAGVPKWFPHQLRHNAATRIEQEHGVEVARIILGHRHASVTEAVYIERDGSVAAKVMQEMG